MSLRDQPLSERIFASLVMLALAGALAVGLTFVATRELRPAPAGGPGQSRLLAVLDGVMAVNTNPSQVAVFRTWVQGGATREGWPPVGEIVANNCSSCHGEGGQYPRLTSYEDLRPLAVEAAPQGLMGFLEARPLHLFGFPALLLLGALIYLRRVAWRGRNLLMAATAGAIAFDLLQWLVRQGGTAHAWAAWTGATLLGAVMAAQAVVVLAELWRPGKA